MAKVHELLATRAAELQHLKDLDEKLKGEKRTMNADEQLQFDRIHERISGLGKQIEMAKVLEEEERAAAHKTVELAEKTGASTTQVQEIRSAMSSYLLHGVHSLTQEERSLLAETKLVEGFERRAAQSAVTANLGAEMVRQEYLNEFERHLKEFGGMYNAARVLRTPTGGILPYPTVNDTANVGELLGENTATAEQAVPTDVVNIGAYKYSSKAILVPMELLQDDGHGFVNEIPSLAAERISRISNTHMTVGTGSGQPQGVVTAAANSSVTITANTITRAKLLDLIHSVDPAYRRAGAKLMFNDDTLKRIIALSIGSGDDRPLWVPSMREGQPDMIEGYGYVINQDMPTIGTSTNKGILFGDFSKYLIRIVQDFQIRRADERHIEKFAVGFYGFSRIDGKCINTNAIKYMAVA